MRLRECRGDEKSPTVGKSGRREVGEEVGGSGVRWGSRVRSKNFENRILMACTGWVNIYL